MTVHCHDLVQDISNTYIHDRSRINDLWASRLEFLARTNYLPLNERLFKINLRESSKCNICDDDIVEDLYHFLF